MVVPCTSIRRSGTARHQSTSSLLEIGVLKSNGKAVDFRGILLGLLAPNAQVDGKHSTKISEASDMQRVPLTQHKSLHLKTVA
jgi:copper homeostasis protein CutC